MGLYDEVVSAVKGFVPKHKHSLIIEYAFIKKDIGLHPDDYCDLLEEIEDLFCVISPLNGFQLSAPDLKISELVEIVSSRKWPDSWVNREC